LNLLIIEDDTSICDTLKMYLCFSRNNIKCVSAETLEEGITELKKSRPDIILLDLLLKGESGLPIIEASRELYPAKPPIIIVMSAMNGAEDLAKEKNADYFVAKPFDLDLLDEILFTNCVKKLDQLTNIR
jgi:DNA-binding response OmpR family regulator